MAEPIFTGKLKPADMKISIKMLIGLFVSVAVIGCNQGDGTNSKEGDVSGSQKEETYSLGEAGVQDDVSEMNALQIAVGSEDHTTLVTAVQTAEMERILTNAGPLTVFAPTNAAFEKLPEGTVEDLLKPENKKKLSNIIQYHAAPGSYGPGDVAGVMGIGQANSQKVDVTEQDGDTYVNDAKIVASVKANNGWVHVIDGVLLPQEK